MGLNPEYESLRSQLLLRERFPILAEAISELMGAESQKKLSSNGGETSTLVSIAHLAKKGEAQSNQNPASPSSQAPKPAPKECNTSYTIICSFCRNYGHLKKDCRKLA